ncbi:cobalamin biosynthesis protein [Ammonicoccus fulvus]|uniref:Cobalamin biosynthesis protein CobD n=1 Tax=Ammonicoccus fulvus TaxID=3138240 RepID=A0ABZ3FSH6_9ACTN
MRVLCSSATGLLVGWLADEGLGDPSRYHPVAGFGHVASALEQKTWRDQRAAGAAHVALLVGTTLLGGVALERLTLVNRPDARRPDPRGPGVLHLALTAAACWAVLGGRSLRREAAAVGTLLAADDLNGARDRIRSLVGRDPTHLSADELARAVIESVAENSSDAVVAPLFWGAVAGIPGLLGYRAINTLDAMIGHRSPRYHRFGWAAARLDDLVNWIPARLAAGLAAAAAPLVGGSPAAAFDTVRADAHKHPSPNAGPVEAAFAGALGVRLGGTNRYGDRVEDRGTLGAGRPVTAADIAGANRLAAAVGVGAAVLATLGAFARQRFLSERRPKVGA